MSSQETIDSEKETLVRAQLPFRAEYCKTSRAKCKKCSELMPADSLKLANMTKSRFHDGLDANFYHVNCFFRIKRPKSVAEIAHFEKLKYDDQKMLEKAVETNGLSVLGTGVDIVHFDTDGKSQKKTKKRKPNNGVEEPNGILVNYDDFMVEYAKSNRSKCNSCDEKIDKDDVRIGKLDYDAETHWNNNPVPRWFHTKCFVKSMEQLEFFGKVDKIEGFKELEVDDRKTLKKTIKPIKPKAPSDVAEKKLKKEELTEEDIEEEKKLRKQSDKIFELRELVNTMKRKDIELMLNYMKQKSDFKSPSSLVDMATDVLLFGPIGKCPSCKHRGGIILNGSNYICIKETENVPCNYETRDPRRHYPLIPEEVSEKYPFFDESYKFIGGKRLFPKTFIKAVEKKKAEDNNIVQGDAPLRGLSFGVLSWKGVSLDKTKVQKKIAILGGKVSTSLDRSLFIILSSEAELSKESPKVDVAKALGVPIAKADFILKIETKKDVVSSIKSCLLDEWSGDLENRYNEMYEEN